MTTPALLDAGWSPEAAGRQNMLQLTHLRWVAVVGQLATIAVVEYGMGVHLPLTPMLATTGALLVLNVLSVLLLARARAASNAALFLALIFDVLSLTVQLYLSGGATNPFIGLFLLQVVLGAILLNTWSTLAIVGLTSLCFALLIVRHRPIELPPALAASLGQLNIAGAWVCFALIAALLVLFVSRINRNLRARDAHLANLRQYAAEEDHIVRMGLLASGAAHELGTPLSSLAVILGDWRRNPVFIDRPDLLVELAEMQAAVARCKTIVTGVLLAAGQARGEAASATTLLAFLDRLVATWRASNPAAKLAYYPPAGPDWLLVADTALQQVIGNVLDNAADASPECIALTVRAATSLVIEVRDAGAGFAPEQLCRIGEPYASTKGKPGGGLGLFLAVNVMRKLGGGVTAVNAEGGGAIVTLTMPLSALALMDNAA